MAEARSLCRLSLSSPPRWLEAVRMGFLASSACRRRLAFHSVWGRVTPRALAIGARTQARRPQRPPHTGKPAGRRIVAGQGPAGEASVRGSLRAAVGIRAAATAFARDGGLRWSWRPSVLVQDPGANAGQRGFFPASEGGATSFWLEPSGANYTFDRREDAGDTCVCGPCQFGCLPGFRITSLVLGTLQWPEEKPHLRAPRRCGRSRGATVRGGRQASFRSAGP
ncbi:hypothetical protein TcCL_NonESM06890 [Trypanosoma cruzi]|nr:hypothetical protein TcCL_NonESM06890 [Trypanosoma cruzi]